MLNTRILTSLTEDCRCDPQKPLILAVSGGADSLSLAHVLKGSGFQVIAAHLDHHLREDSSKQAERLAEIMRSWGYAFEAGSANVLQVSEELKLGTEEAARFCRYRFLFELAHKYQAQAIVTAHHADDQVETVLMHYLRGSGLNGLSGMHRLGFLPQFDSEIPIFRPMLGIFREEIRQYCSENELEVQEDQSNADPSFFRNRLRLRLLPELETYNPGIKNVLLRSAEALRADREILEALEIQAFKECEQENPQAGAIVLKRDCFTALMEGLQWRVLVYAAHKLKPGLRDLGLNQVMRVRKAILAGQEQVDLKGGMVVWSLPDEIVIALPGCEPGPRGLPQLRSIEPQPLPKNGYVMLKEGWSLSSEMLDGSKYRKLPKSQQQDPQQAWLNPADLEWPLEVRAARPGEVWSPLGMVLQHQKLSDFFINNKIPQKARAAWPLVLSGGSFLWVAGLRIAQPWRLLGDEVEVLHLQLHSP